MHSLTNQLEQGSSHEAEDILVAVLTLVIEGRIPGPSPTGCKKFKDFYEGPHSNKLIGIDQTHTCDTNNELCEQFLKNKETILKTFKRGDSICVEVLFTCCCKNLDLITHSNFDDDFILLEQWYFSIDTNRDPCNIHLNINQLLSAVRSQLYFSQVTAWLVTQDKSSPFASKNFRYRLSTPQDLIAPITFSLTASKHEFPCADLGNGSLIKVSFLSAPRTSIKPVSHCLTCSLTTLRISFDKEEMELVDDRMQTSCTVKGKHCCEDMDESDSPKSGKGIKRDSNLMSDNANGKEQRKKAHDKSKSRHSREPSELSDKVCWGLNEGIQEARAQLERHTRTQERCHNLDDLKTVQSKGQMLLDAIERSGKKNGNNGKMYRPKLSECDNFYCDMSESDTLFSCKEKYKFNKKDDRDDGNHYCDKMLTKKFVRKNGDFDDNAISTGARKKITFDGLFTDFNKTCKPCSIQPVRESTNKVIELEDDTAEHATTNGLPLSNEPVKIKRNLGNSIPSAFDDRTGLPLSSSPAPVRKGQSRFEFDSSLNTVSAIKSALFSSSFSTDEESENEGGLVSPCSPEIYAVPRKEFCPPIYRRRGRSTGLLGTFEESVLNGRLEPVSTVHGFTAELGASGSFVPKHIFVPVTTYFYAFGDQDKVSTPYMGHIRLGKKGYNIPKAGTVQVTLFNPLRTVVKMFVLPYDLSDMPPSSQTFIRQRTYYMPTGDENDPPDLIPKWLRFVINIRFMSSKSGKIYLHSDIRMIIIRKSDMDTATAHDIEKNYELRSFVTMPTNPKYSSRK